MEVPLQIADDSDPESILGDDSESETTSLHSSILEHRRENGRTYHKFRGGQNDYWGPNDQQMNEQLDLGHHMLTLLLQGKLYLAPIDENCRNVIDLGCGTGIWTIDFADAHPLCDVIGADLSPTQPSWVPTNCRFLVDDVTSPWTYPENHFDFVHVRNLYGSVSDWPALYREMYSHIRPGGFIEQMEISIEFRSDDNSVGPGHVMAEWSRIFIEAGRRTGKSMTIADDAASLIRAAGFTDVQEVWYKVPVGKWPRDKMYREVGLFNYHFCNNGFEGWALYLLTRIMGWSVPQVQDLVARMKDALRDRRNHAYYRIVVVHGQKPAA